MATAFYETLMALVILGLACSSSEPAATTCRPGTIVDCLCSDGSMGSQFCGTEGEPIDVCDCGTPRSMDASMPDSMVGTCTPDCSGRECGPDPRCGTDCGACDGTCDTDGQCQPLRMDPDGPRILSWAVSQDVLTPRRQLTFSVVLTDPDGIDDIVGGTLVDTLGRAYGTFATQAAEGSYSLALVWHDVNRIEDITANSPEGTTRTLVARFFDVAGHETSREVVLQLRCDDTGESPCSGECHDLLIDEQHCGSCDFDCSAADGDYCQTGRCISQERRSSPQVGDTCNDVCEEHGASCVSEPLEEEDDSVGTVVYRGNVYCSDSVELATCDSEIETSTIPNEPGCTGVDVLTLDAISCTCEISPS